MKMECEECNGEADWFVNDLKNNKAEYLCSKCLRSKRLQLGDMKMALRKCKCGSVDFIFDFKNVKCAKCGKVGIPCNRVI